MTTPGGLGVNRAAAAAYLLDANGREILQRHGVDIRLEILLLRWSMLLELILLTAMASLGLVIFGYLGIFLIPAAWFMWVWGIRSNRDGNGSISIATALGFFIPLLGHRRPIEIVFCLIGILFAVVQRTRYLLPGIIVRRAALGSTSFRGWLLSSGIAFSLETQNSE